jgi:porphyrinogen peroxidase
VPEPQSLIIPQPGATRLYLVLKVKNPAANTRAVARVVTGVPALTAEVGGFDHEAKLVSAIGIGSEFWDLVSPQKRPKLLRPFKAIEAEGRSAPATGGDLFLHVISKRFDLNFELALRMRRQLGEMVEVMDEVHGFAYLDSRDTIGFIDGTENPHTDEERRAAAIIGDEDPGFAGGSYILTQHYIHNLEKWRTLSDQEQELVIGRRKADSEELPDDIKPPTAHIARVVIEENGEELAIVRNSSPYGTVSEQGLFLVAYCKTLDTLERMLSRMIGAAGDGLHDRLLEFTRAISGAYFFAPSLDTLKALA